MVEVYLYKWNAFVSNIILLHCIRRIIPNTVKNKLLDYVLQSKHILRAFHRIFQFLV